MTELIKLTKKEVSWAWVVSLVFGVIALFILFWFSGAFGVI